MFSLHDLIGVAQHMIIVHDLGTIITISTNPPRLSHVSTTLVSYSKGEIRIQTSTKEVEMSTKRFFIVLTVAVLLVVIALTAQLTLAAGTNANEVDSATRSYMAWAKAVEVNSALLDSATRSYTAWAKAVGCGADLGSDRTIDSATRSYIAWAKSVQCKNVP
jgi:beta-lactamase class D